jgi:hypothetical protein
MPPSARSMIAVLAIVSMCLVPGARAQQAKRPFAFHDMRLGTPLSELRELRFLDEEERDKVRLICSSEAESWRIEQLHPTNAGSPDAIRCALFQKGNGTSPKPARIEAYGAEMDPMLVLYRGKRDHEVRLAQILVTLANDRYQEIVSLLEKSYGPANDYQVSVMATPMGSTLNAIYYWTNGVSSIQVEQITQDVHRMVLIYTYDALIK